MRRVILGFVLCACAPPGPPDKPQPQPIIYQSAGGAIFGEGARSENGRVAAPRSAVWVAAGNVYAELGIPIAVVSEAKYEIGNNNFNRTHTMAGHLMTEFLDCGSNMSGDRAASSRIFMSMITDILPDSGGGSIVRTVITAEAQDLSGSGTNRSPCASTSKLEQLFLDRVTALVAKKGK